METVPIRFDRAGVGHGPRRLGPWSLAVDAGQVHVVLGGAGSGKSALIALCHGGLEAETGTVLHFGAPRRRGDRATRAMLRRRLGVIECPARLVAHLTLAENLAVPLVAAGVPLARRSADIDALLAWIGLAGQKDALPAALSAAERQRVAIARAVILDPEVVLADDPAAGLEPEEAEGVLGLLADLGSMGRTLLVATTSPEQAAFLAERLPLRILRLDAGRLDAA
jgi:cell division transport system ATP-binding protein